MSYLMVAAELAPPTADLEVAGRIPPVTPTRAASTRDRLVAAFLVNVARCGYSRTTLDDVAREAGCSRATLYRYFPGKAPLARAAVAGEAERYLAGLRAVAAAAPDLEAVLVDGLVHTARFLEDNDALQFLLRSEPEVVVTHLCFTNGDRFLRLACSALEPVLSPFLPGGRPGRDCEWVARIALAYLAPENTSTDLTDRDQARELVRDFLLPSLAGNPSGPDRTPERPAPRTSGPTREAPRPAPI